MTTHMFGYFDYVVGIRFSFKKNKYMANRDNSTRTVLPERLEYRFEP